MLARGLVEPGVGFADRDNGTVVRPSLGVCVGVCGMSRLAVLDAGGWRGCDRMVTSPVGLSRTQGVVGLSIPWGGGVSACPVRSGSAHGGLGRDGCEASDSDRRLHVLIPVVVGGPAQMPDIDIAPYEEGESGVGPHFCPCPEPQA